LILLWAVLVASILAGQRFVTSLVVIIEGNLCHHFQIEDRRLGVRRGAGRGNDHGVVANRGTRRHGAIAAGRDSAALGRVRSGEDRLRRAGGRQETHHRRHFGHGFQPANLNIPEAMVGKTRFPNF